MAAWTEPGRSALIVIDVQNGFMPGGGLPVPLGHEIVPIINALARRFEHVVLTQDWHPADHTSFAQNHPGREPFSTLQLPYGEQVLWPTHCVQGSQDADFHPDLHIPHARLILRKGTHAAVDSYSAFLEADRTSRTGLTEYLRVQGIQKLVLCGLATDFCVAWSALDARAQGFEVAVVEDACRAIDLNGSLEQAWQQMEKQNIARLQSKQLL